MNHQIGTPPSSDYSNATSTAENHQTLPALPPVDRKQFPSWLLPTVTGIGGFLLGGIFIGGIFGIGQAISAANVQAAADEEEAAIAAIFDSALDECGLTASSGAEVGDGGRSLTINHRGEDDFDGLDYSQLQCVIVELKTPAAVQSHMDQTTSLDGRQTESWDRISVSWSYHPDRGMDAVFTIQ